MTSDDIMMIYFGTGIVFGIIAVIMLNKQGHWDEADDFEEWIMNGMERFLGVLMCMMIWPGLILFGLLKMYYDSSRKEEVSGY